jgi:hypothetical protein
MRAILLISVAVVVAGCNRYAMQDIRMVNPKATGPDVVAVCDTCQERSPCGDRDSTLVWANDHAKDRSKQGSADHRSFHRQACSSGLKPVPKYTPDEDRASNPFLKPAIAPPKPPATQAAKGELTLGMTLKEARSAMGNIGVTESETVDERVVRFEQTTMVEGTPSTRTLHARFKDGALVEVKSDPWK